MKKEEKVKKKKARVLLLVFLKNLKGKCGIFTKAEEWDKFIKDNLLPFLHEFEQVIPDNWQEKIKNASKLKDKSKKAIDASCKALQKNIKGLIKYLPKGGIFSNPWIKTLIGVAAGGGILVSVLNATAVTVNIFNHGCETIYPSIYSFVRIPGLILPDSPIEDGGTGIAQLPPLKFRVEAEQNKINLKALNMNLGFGLESAGIELVFDGVSLMNKTSEVDLGSSRIHTLDINCNL